MDNSAAVNLPCWYAIHTHAKQEGRAESNLRAWKVETFSPKLKEYKRSAHGQTPVAVIKHLFPGYIFARFRAVELLHKVSFTRGVKNVVGFGKGPAPIDDQIISLIKSREMKDGLIEVGRSLKRGDRVQVVNGPLKSLEGIFEREISGSDRVLILMDAIHYQGSIVVHSSHVRPI